MEKIWLKHYPEGVPEEIDTNEYTSVVEMYDVSVAKHRDRAAYTNMGLVLTYGQLDTHVEQLAAYLQQVLAMKKGDRIAIILPNILQFPICLFAALKAGLVVINVNPLYTARELIHQLNDASVDTVIVLANMAYVLEKALSNTRVKHIILAELGDLFPKWKGTLINFAVRYIKRIVPKFHLPNVILLRDILQKKGNRLSFQPVSIKHDDLALLQYTGGTTGVAKGAMLTHNNLIANLLQAKVWLSPVMHNYEDEIIITALPLYHIFSLTCNCLMFFTCGGLNVLITNPRDVFGFVKELAKYKFTVITAVNTLFNALLHVPKFSHLDFSRLKLAVAGGMALQRHVAEEWHRVTGGPIIEGYGLTETSPILTINPATITSFTGSIGLPVSSTLISIRDDEGREVLLGEPGEICARGPQVMQGYWNRPEETTPVFTEDGYFRTGDIATMDEGGYLRIVDRKKDMILVSGFNVFPNEIEAVISQHPAVLEVAVIGAPDDRSGEVVKAVIVRKSEELDEEAVMEFCNSRLARYKVPKLIEFRTELPKSNVGKILRRALR